MKPRCLICFYTSNFEDILEKGVSKQYENFLEGGFFEKIIFICPLARNTLSVKYTSKIEIRQIGWRIGCLNARINLLLKYPIFFFQILWFMLSFFREAISIKQRYTVITRSTDPFLIGTFGWLISWIFRFPFVVSIHSNYDLTNVILEPNSRIKVQVRELLQRFLLSKANLIFVIRKNIGDTIGQRMPKVQSKIRLIPHGVDTVKIDSIVNNRFSLEKSGFIVSFVGRLSPENFVLDVVALGIEIQRTGLKDFEIIIVGDGPLRRTLEYEIDKAALQDKIKVLGFLSFEEVIKIRKRSISFVPMGGMSLLEAMASKSCTIAYDVDWHAEIIKNDVNGYIVSMGDVTAAANIISSIINNKKTRDRIENQARHSINKIYSQTSSMEQKVKYYSELLKL